MKDFDLPSLFKAHGHHLEYGLLMLIIFGAGFQTGKITSPYYDSTPIIFQETDGTATVAGEGSGDTDALEALQAQGEQLEQPAEVQSVTITAEVAGATTKTEGQFVASVNSNLFHRADCPSASRIKAENQVWFNSIEEAQAAGYQPSQCTLEKLQIQL